MKKILLTILSVLSVSVFAQKHEQVELKWNDIQSVATYKDMNVNFISFDNSVTVYDYASLPIYLKKMQNTSSVLTYEAEIDNVVCDTLSVEDSEIISDKDLISDNFIVEFSNDNIQILPLKYNTDKNRIIRLLSFDLMIDMVPVIDVKQQTVNKHVFASNSVLAEGKWFKMGILNTGIHKLERQDLEEMGINPDNINLSKIGIFGNYEGMLHEANNKERPDDLKENPAEYVGLEDGSFDEGDYILFYAQSQEIWKYNPFSVRFDHYKNIYADTVYYFFTPDMGTQKGISSEESLNTTPTVVVDSYVDFISHEVDSENLMYTGKDWFGEQLTITDPEITFTHNIPHLKIGDPVFFSIKAVARSYVASSFKTYLDDAVIVDSTSITKVSPSSDAIYAREAQRSTTFLPVMKI